MVKTEDGIKLEAGERAFNYYGRKPGVIGDIESDGWFDFNHDDGTKAFLNGERICSVEFAKRKGWM